VVTMSDAREALKAAHVAREKAERAVEAARAATNRARALLDGVVRDAEDLRALDQQTSSQHAVALKEALRRGDAPPVRKASQRADAAKLAEAEDHVRAAEAAVAELRSEEVVAEQGVASAREAVGDAVQGTLRATAAQIAQKWAAVHAESRALRERLGPAHGNVSRLRGLDAVTKAAIDANENDPLEYGYLQSRARMDACWVDFAASLARDSEALILFEPADDASPVARAAE
jgi:hypothetical protein